MMKNICLFLLVFCLNGCRKVELSVDLPYQGDKLVVYGLIVPTEIVSVKVTKTYPPTGKITYIDGISDAEVLLFENDKLVEKLKYTGSGIYKSETSFKPKEKFAYSLKINAKGFPLVSTSNEIVPTLPKILSFKFDEKIESSLNKGRPARKFILNIADNDRASNFFSIKLEAFWQDTKANLVNFSIDQASGADSPCFFEYVKSFILNDVCFSNVDYEFKRGFEMNPIFEINNDFVRKDPERVVAKICQINKSYYEFCKTYYDEEGLLQAFNTPNPRYSNIKGGYGIFAAYNEVLIDLPVK
ncbi:MAG: DUF4249 domain-containing protein [Emticicia sp.]|nr:DUF4249 domain-containing protein [Emticicia sp.]